MTDYTPIQRVVDEIDEYVRTGIVSSDFLFAVLTNNLSGAFAYADRNHLEHINLIVMYLYNKCPIQCWGSPMAVNNWYKDKQHPEIVKLPKGETK